MVERTSENSLAYITDSGRTCLQRSPLVGRRSRELAAEPPDRPLTTAERIDHLRWGTTHACGVLCSTHGDPRDTSMREMPRCPRDCGHHLLAHGPMGCEGTGEDGMPCECKSC